MSAGENEGPGHAPKPDYEVGYGKPPVSTQFKKGQSGNPKGRPRAQKNASTTIREILEQQIPVTVNGRKRNMPALAATLQILLQNALRGDQKAIRQLFAVAKEAGQIGQNGESGDVELPIDDDAIIDAFLKRHSDSNNMAVEPPTKDEPDDP